MDAFAVLLIYIIFCLFIFFLGLWYVCTYWIYVISLFHRADFSPVCNTYHLFTLPFLSKQTRHGRNIISFYFFLFIWRGPKCSWREQCLVSRAMFGIESKSRRLVLQFESEQYLERWPAVLYEAGRSVLMLTFWRRNYFFLILAHSVYKMWTIQEPNMLELWNRLHFEENKTEGIHHV